MLHCGLETSDPSHCHSFTFCWLFRKTTLSLARLHLSTQANDIRVRPLMVSGMESFYTSLILVGHGWSTYHTVVDLSDFRSSCHWGTTMRSKMRIPRYMLYNGMTYTLIYFYKIPNSETPGAQVTATASPSAGPSGRPRSVLPGFTSAHKPMTSEWDHWWWVAWKHSTHHSYWLVMVGQHTIPLLIWMTFEALATGGHNVI